jgi:predicted RNA-binding protein with RPS1 domain
MEEIKNGKIVIGEITGITEYGIFVKVNPDYTGMIHISEISDNYVEDIAKLYVIGETLETRIIEIDAEKKQLKLSIKEFTKKNKRSKTLKEEGRGFEPLREKLDFWVEERLKDLKK